jgi:hypothetical protein
MSTTQTTQTTSEADSRIARLEVLIHELLHDDAHADRILKLSAVSGGVGLLGYLFATALAFSGANLTATIVWSLGVISMTGFLICGLVGSGLKITVKSTN